MSKRISGCLLFLGALVGIWYFILTLAYFIPSDLLPVSIRDFYSARILLVLLLIAGLGMMILVLIEGIYRIKERFRHDRNKKVL